MRVALAYRYGDHAPDDVVDLPDDDARRLLSDGQARIPTADDLARVAADTTPTDSGSGRTETKEQ